METSNYRCDICGDYLKYEDLSSKESYYRPLRIFDKGGQCIYEDCEAMCVKCIKKRKGN